MDWGPPAAISGGGAAFRRLIGAGDGRGRAILFRQVATPNYELRSFLRACRRLGFHPVILTYHRDRMSCHNPFKRALVAPIFVERANCHGQPIWRRRNLIHVETIEKKRLSDVRIGDWTLPDLHETFLKHALPDERFSLIDGSDWFGRYPEGARAYYRDIFLGLDERTVLFETYLTIEKEARFVKQVVQPAFQSALQSLGKKPVIFQLCVGRHQGSHLWFAYPDSYRAELAAFGLCP